MEQKEIKMLRYKYELVLGNKSDRKVLIHLKRKESWVGIFIGTGNLHLFQYY